IVASVKSSLFLGSSHSTRSSVNSRELAEQAGETASRVGRSLIEGVRENPVPAALMGAGLAWLLFEDKAERAYRRRRLAANAEARRSLRSHSGSYVDARTGKPYDESYGAGYEDFDGDGEPDVEPKSLMDRASETAGSIKHAAQGAAGAVGSAAS